MRAQLIESEGEHHWVLLDHRISGLVVERRNFRIQTWSLDSSLEVLVSGAASLRTVTGGSRTIEAGRPETLAALLGFVGAEMRSVTVLTVERRLSVEFGDGTVLAVEGAGWAVSGAGALEGVGYEGVPSS
ncbi:MAG: hypothetical protein JWO05_977 [Gemmatimonadetes bacterium]|nr:hypothetical protein [Gemmatimonadota bacterium]